MNNILNSISQTTSVSSNDSVAIVHDNKLYQVSQLKIGDQVSIKDVKTSGIYIGYIEIDGIKTELYANGGNFDDLDIQFSPESYDYDGMPIEVTNLVVKLNTETLVKNTDYVVTYSNNKNAGTAQVIITAKEGNTKGYSGSKSKDFTINKINMSGITGSDGSGNSSTGASISISGAPDESTIYYKYGSNDWSTTNPVIKTLGETVINWKVTKSNYNDFAGSNKVTITKKYTWNAIANYTSTDSLRSSMHNKGYNLNESGSTTRSSSGTAANYLPPASSSYTKPKWYLLNRDASGTYNANRCTGWTTV